MATYWKSKQVTLILKDSNYQMLEHSNYNFLESLIENGSADLIFQENLNMRFEEQFYIQNTSGESLFLLLFKKGSFNDIEENITKIISKSKENDQRLSQETNFGQNFLHLLIANATLSLNQKLSLLIKIRPYVNLENAKLIADKNDHIPLTLFIHTSKNFIEEDGKIPFELIDTLIPKLDYQDFVSSVFTKEDIFHFSRLYPLIKNSSSHHHQSKLLLKNKHKANDAKSFTKSQEYSPVIENFTNYYSNYAKYNNKIFEAALKYNSENLLLYLLDKISTLDGDVLMIENHGSQSENQYIILELINKGFYESAKKLINKAKIDWFKDINMASPIYILLFEHLEMEKNIADDKILKAVIDFRRSHHKRIQDQKQKYKDRKNKTLEAQVTLLKQNLHYFKEKTDYKWLCSTYYHYSIIDDIFDYLLQLSLSNSQDKDKKLKFLEGLIDDIFNDFNDQDQINFLSNISITKKSQPSFLINTEMRMSLAKAFGTNNEIIINHCK